MNSAASSSSPPPTKKPKSVQLQDPAEGCGSTPATTTTTTGIAKPRVILRHKRNRSITRLPAANENARQQQEQQEQQEQQIDNTHEDNAPLATRTRSQQARDSHGGSGSDDKTKKKKNSITIRPMQLRDLATVYQLGNQIFTASEFPNMYRTWDDYAVAGNYEGSAEFCFVAEHTSTSTTLTKLPVAKSVSTSALRSSSSSVSPTPVGHGKKPVRKSQSNVKEANNKSTTTTTTTIVAFLLGESVTKANVGTRGYIQWVAVVPAFRRLGIASSLIAEFVKVGQQQNISLLLADTPADNEPAIELFQKAGLSHKADHVYLTRQLGGVVDQLNYVDEEDMSFDFSYTVTMPNTGTKQRITIRNMEIGDLYPIYKIGEEIFTTKSVNLYNFWDESLVVNSYLSDPEFCVVATATTKGGTEDTSEHHGNSGNSNNNNNNNNNNNEDHRPNVEKVVGFAFGETIEKPRSSWKYGYLVWLGCAPDYQGMGLAKQLYHVMMELFAVEKVRMVMIDTQQNNEGALRFFRKLGFGHDEEHVYLCNRP
ncbi:hypothetical protein ACA910_018863 [Epithemia clementina (nom. ined.)]